MAEDGQRRIVRTGRKKGDLAWGTGTEPAAAEALADKTSGRNGPCIIRDSVLLFAAS